MLKSELISQLVAINPQAESLQIFKLELAELLKLSLVGLQISPNEFSACSISIDPWLITEDRFSLAMQTAQALSSLFRAVANNINFLTEALADFVDQSSLIFQLKTNLVNYPKQLATGLNLSRQDLLLDKSGLWRLVESNSIAAGMGPFCEALRQIQISYFAHSDKEFPANPATSQIAQHLFDAAFRLNNNANPLIIFVVIENEDNIHDQNKIASALIQLGARVIRKTLKQLSEQLTATDQKKISIEKNIVDCFYFRTGYNLADYNDSAEEHGNFLNLRFWIEQHQVVVAPLANQQLATSKWVQMKLSKLSVDSLMKLFKLDKKQAELAVNSLALKYVLPKNLIEIEQYLATGLWILKTQNEGGGNVADKNSLKLTRVQPDAQFILMEKIDTVIRENGLTAFANNKFKLFAKAISELGLLTLGETDSYGGYLLRSKPANQLETGVHQAGGVLDSLRILPK